MDQAYNESEVKFGMKEPLIQDVKINLDVDDSNQRKNDKKGSIGVVLLSTFVAVMGSFEFGSCVGYSAPIQSSIREDIDLSLAEFSFFGSILTVGSMIGAITSGNIADFLGRKRAMRISAVICITGWIAIYFSQEALMLDAGRFLTGYGIGVFSYVVPIYIAEIAPKDLRGGLATMNQLMIVIGASTTFILGTVVHWKTLALAGTISCIVQLAGLLFIPESPRWLAKAGYIKDVEDALRTLRGIDVDISYEAAEIQDSLAILQNQPKAALLDLFQRRYLCPLTIGVGLMVFQQFGGVNGIGFYVSETFVLAGFSGKVGTLAFACIQIPVTALAAFLMDNCGRKPLLLVSATGTFLGTFLAGTAFLLKDHELLSEWIPVLVLSGVLLYIGSFAIGMGSVPWIVMSEIFPINVKGAAGGAVNLFHWFGAWTVSYTFNFLMAWSPSGTFYLYSGICGAAVLFVAKLVPETKGRTLEEIQTSFNQF